MSPDKKFCDCKKKKKEPNSDSSEKPDIVKSKNFSEHLDFNKASKSCNNNVGLNNNKESKNFDDKSIDVKYIKRTELKKSFTPKIYCNSQAFKYNDEVTDSYRQYLENMSDDENSCNTQPKDKNKYFVNRGDNF